MPELHKYSGAGNDFVVLDGRKEDVSEFRTPERIAALCDRKSGFAAADGRIGADGLMILNGGDAEYDFRMEYYNSDGSGGMMCGNGGISVGTVVESGAVIASGVIITASTAIFDATTGEFVPRNADGRVVVPHGAVVVSGSKPLSRGPAAGSGVALYCPVIVKYRDEKTAGSVVLEDLLR